MSRGRNVMRFEARLSETAARWKLSGEILFAQFLSYAFASTFNFFLVFRFSFVFCSVSFCKTCGARDAWKMKQNNMKVPAICHLLVTRPVHLHFFPCSTHFSCFNQHIRSFGCKTFLASVIYEFKKFIALYCRAITTSRLCNECLFEVLIHDNDPN